jgi:putative transposase
VAPRKNNATRLGAHLVFVDESGFLLIPSVRRTWAPIGQTPLLRHWQRHDRISVISALSVSPGRQRLGLYFHLHDDNLHAAEVCAFLRVLLRHLRGAVIVLWDGGNIHKGPLVRALCAAFPRLHLERFPPYAPELNPDEGVWTLAKGQLANGRPDDRGTLRAHLLVTLLGIRRSPRLLRGCITQSDLPPFLH